MRQTPHRLALTVVANPGTASFSHAMAAVARQVLAQRGYEVAFHDLYAEQLDPVQPMGEMASTANSGSGSTALQRVGWLEEVRAFSRESRLKPCKFSARCYKKLSIEFRNSALRLCASRRGTDA